MAGRNEVNATATCRIDRTVVIGIDEMCADRGANGTLLAVSNDIVHYCPGSMVCKYSPFAQKSVDDWPVTI